MFNNPFTPESQIAKKSLFLKKVQYLNFNPNIEKVVKKAIVEIKKIKTVIYGDPDNSRLNLRIKVEQVEFLYRLENQLVHDKFGRDTKEIRLKLLTGGDRIIVSRRNHIMELNLSRMGLSAMPNSINRLKFLKKLDCRQNRFPDRTKAWISKKFPFAQF